MRQRTATVPEVCSGYRTWVVFNVVDKFCEYLVSKSTQCRHEWGDNQCSRAQTAATNVVMYSMFMKNTRTSVTNEVVSNNY